MLEVTDEEFQQVVLVNQTVVSSMSREFGKVMVAHLAEVYNVGTGFHDATDLSSVTMAAALHFNTAIHNYGIQEHMPHEALVDEVFPHAYYFRDGFMYAGHIFL